MATMSVPLQTIPLTNKLHVNNGSHILYFYGEQDRYIENAVSFILAGFQLDQHVMLIESQEKFQLIYEKVKEAAPHQLDKLEYIDSYEFYRMYEDFHFDRVLANLDQAIQPYLHNNLTARLWGHVDWKSQEDMLSKLHTYECQADLSVSELGYLTVCAYDGNIVPSIIQIEMMKTHEYLMTDHELVLSNLYKKSAKEVCFPTLSAQTKLESEVDLYKQKLDFVHVVSHEVRNPLTVIKAYASLLLAQENTLDKEEKLKGIVDYVTLIDNEITHIINTEQMLSTDALWKKRLTQIYPLIEEVISIMEIKARTQNIHLTTSVSSSPHLLLNCNSIGFKLIISNLLSNAIKYSEEGQTVTLTAHTKEDHLELVVEDNGVGMSEEQMQMLFRKYEKMNQDKSGQGIGLFMVKNLIESFDGEIEVGSELGTGTRVVVRFPLK
ncbi:MEDS domain-containing protein [Brevibacillus dissolubilis]|uniref:MEDS domain-containing protein n=1 Tax=Brevibacillus dissolubilis TaxID=1844116 RepID=UPI0011175E52|nr:ATP-binding protein [Brevibacillus dissolubilis]